MLSYLGSHPGALITLPWLAFSLMSRGILISCHRTGNISLLVYNSGPASLDSCITFHAELVGFNKEVLDPEYYTYHWFPNTGTSLHEEVEAGKNCTLHLTFNSLTVRHGSYRMKVKVYEKKAKSEILVASGQTSFDLTEYLNVVLNLSQSNLDSTPTGVFCTNKNITLTANILDKFANATFLYTWQVNHQTGSSVMPDYTISYREPGEYPLTVNVTATLSESMTVPFTLNKFGTATRFILLKDPVSSLMYTGNNGTVKGDILQGYISCSGSPPFVVCFNITGPNGWHKDSCLSAEAECYMPVSFSLPSLGLYNLHITAFNDVSYLQTSVNITVHDPEVPAVMPFVPLACVFVSLVILISLFTSYHYDRKQITSMETADFDFVRMYRRRSSLTLQQVKGFLHQTVHTSHEQWTLVRDKLKALFRKGPRENELQLPPRHTDQYGSINVVA